MNAVLLHCAAESSQWGKLLTRKTGDDDGLNIHMILIANPVESHRKDDMISDNLQSSKSNALSLFTQPFEIGEYSANMYSCNTVVSDSRSLQIPRTYELKMSCVKNHVDGLPGADAMATHRRAQGQPIITTSHHDGGQFTPLGVCPIRKATLPATQKLDTGAYLQLVQVSSNSRPPTSRHWRTIRGRITQPCSATPTPPLHLRRSKT
jgi:hypothetical protein